MFVSIFANPAENVCYTHDWGMTSLSRATSRHKVWPSENAFNDRYYVQVRALVLHPIYALGSSTNEV